jgi:glycosyltransferase involved in cell wall biosynthesis
LRILHVLNHLERLNGHVHATVDLACAQARLGHEVSVASGLGSLSNVLTANSVGTIRVDQRRRLPTAAMAVIELAKLMRRHRFDVVHAHMVTSALLSWPACKATGIPLVTTVHNEFERSAIGMGVGRRVIAVSGAVARSMVERGIPASRVRTVLNGTIGTPRYAAPSGPPAALGPASILSVGGLHPRKGLPDLLQAFQIVSATVPAATLHVVGEGPCEAEYKAAAAAMPCAGAITFYGGIDDPRPWYLGADVFVLPSHAEPAGLVLSEACEAGCAIVASDVGGIPDMLDGGRAGVLVPPKNPTMMAAALTTLLTDPCALLQGRRRALANIPRMSLDRVAQETLDVYRECTDPRAS